MFRPLLFDNWVVLFKPKKKLRFNSKIISSFEDRFGVFYEARQSSYINRILRREKHVNTGIYQLFTGLNHSSFNRTKARRIQLKVLINLDY